MVSSKFSYPLVEPICIRQLNIVNSEESIIIKLWQPCLLEDNIWSCAFQIDVANKDSYTAFSPGGDSFQALILALKWIQYHLDYVIKVYEMGLEFRNLNPIDPSDHCFPFFDPAIPSFKYDIDGQLKQI